MENDVSRMENEATPELEVAAASSPPAWGAREWIFLFSALLAAGCYFFAHFPGILERNGHLPGVGLTLTQWLLAGVSLAAARKKGKLRGKSAAGGWLLLVIALALGLCYSVFADDAMRLMNLPVVWLTTALSLFSLTGLNPLSVLEGRGLRLGLRRFLPSPSSPSLPPPSPPSSSLLPLLLLPPLLFQLSFLFFCQCKFIFYPRFYSLFSFFIYY